jgi:cellulose synthase/poly-beta-1,6-N-acetylglucosamine synthase-like glycosyltransferase
MSFLITIYILAALLLALYAFNAWVLTILYLKHRTKTPVKLRSPDNEHLPPVTVQLPVYNEALVVERLIDSVVKLDYPAHLLQIQVLDDSSDETTTIAADLINRYRRQGVNITLVRRPDRIGFKAGALKHGLKSASGEIIATVLCREAQGRHYPNAVGAS